MKKLSIILLIATSAIFLALGCQEKNTADAFSSASTEIVLPSSYLEYCELNAPIDVFTDGNRFVIAETNRIVYFDGSLYSTYDLIGYSLSKVSMIENKILFLSQSKLYTIDVLDETKQVVDSGLTSSTYFTINDNLILTNTSSTIEWRTIEVVDNNLTITEQISSYNLGYTANIFAYSNNVLYYAYEGSVYQHTQIVVEDQLIATNIQNIRGMAIYSDSIYVTSATGLYKITTNQANAQSSTLIVPISQEEKLNNLVTPRGLCLASSKLYISDSMLNAVSEFDITTNQFTNFHITSGHYGINRISKNASSIFADSDSLYILDKDQIAVLDSETEQTRTITIPHFENAKYITASDDTILLATNSEIILINETANSVSSVTILADISQLKNIASIAVYESYYYILNNEIRNSENLAVLYKLSSNGRLIYREAELEGLGHTVACDLFGDIYIQTEKNNLFSIYKTNTAKAVPTLFATTIEPLISFYADYEGNLFALKTDNIITKFSPNGNTNDFAIELSKNLPIASKAKGLAIAWGNNKSYLLYDGYILSVNSEELGVSTPKMIKVPSDFNLNFTTSPNFVTVKKDSKLFKVDLSCSPNFGEYFDYKEMTSQQSSNEQFVLLLTTDRYSLIANAKSCAIVRSEDVKLCSIVKTATDEQSYFVNNCSIYSQPIIADFTTSAQATKNTKVIVKSTFTFNGIEFSLIEGNSVGYVASSMLKCDLASNQAYTNYTVYTVTQEAIVYSDIMFINETGSLEKGVQVKVLKISDDKASILLDGKVYYIDANALTPQGDQILRNVIIVALLGVGVLISAIFIARKLLKR